jgi:steroid 5-alpha reductase family enzyme
MSFPLLVLFVLLAMAAVMSTGWFVQRAAGNAGWVDVFWTFGTGATCALTALAPRPGAAGPDGRQLLVAALVALWSIRLGVYVARRVATSREDVRYTELRREWGAGFQTRMIPLMLVQAPATALLSVSVILAARAPHGPLGLRDALGALVLLAAVAGEGLADEQMKRFKAADPPKDAVCEEGMWGWSRHPNYVFEWLGWAAYPVIGLDLARPGSFWTVLSLLVMYLILRFVTGVPPLEAAMVRSKGDAYRAYQDRVGVFFPTRFRGGRA